MGTPLIRGQSIQQSPGSGFIEKYFYHDYTKRIDLFDPSKRSLTPQLLTKKRAEMLIQVWSLAGWCVLVSWMVEKIHVQVTVADLLYAMDQLQIWMIGIHCIMKVVINCPGWPMVNCKVLSAGVTNVEKKIIRASIQKFVNLRIGYTELWIPINFQYWLSWK